MALPQARTRQQAEWQARVAAGVAALTTNDGDVARHWCEQGLGLVLRSEWDAAPAVARGKLVRLLADWSFGDVPAIALTPARKGATARVNELLRFLQAGFRPKPHWRL